MNPELKNIQNTPTPNSTQNPVQSSIGPEIYAQSVVTNTIISKDSNKSTRKLVIFTLVISSVLAAVVIYLYINMNNVEDSINNPGIASEHKATQDQNEKLPVDINENIYYRIGEGITDEKVEVHEAYNGTKAISTSFVYAHSNGKKYNISTDQTITKQKFACEKINGSFAIVEGGIPLLCSYQFTSPNGILVFRNDAIGHGDRSLYFVLDTTLLSVMVDEVGGYNGLTDKAIVGEIVDGFAVKNN